jgi:hypothetical protein
MVIFDIDPEGYLIMGYQDETEPPNLDIDDEGYLIFGVDEQRPEYTYPD